MTAPPPSAARSHRHRQGRPAKAGPMVDCEAQWAAMIGKRTQPRSRRQCAGDAVTERGAARRHGARAGASPRTRRSAPGSRRPTASAMGTRSAALRRQSREAARRYTLPAPWSINGRKSRAAAMPLEPGRRPPYGACAGTSWPRRRGISPNASGAAHCEIDQLANVEATLPAGAQRRQQPRAARSRTGLADAPVAADLGPAPLLATRTPPRYSTAPMRP